MTTTTPTFTRPQMRLLTQVLDGSHLMYNAPYMGRFGRGGPSMFCIADQKGRPMSEATFEKFKRAGYIAHKPGTHEYAVTDAGRAAAEVVR